MNCKAGDMAVIVRGPAFKKFWGRIVQVVETDGILWRLAESLDGDPKYWLLVPDGCLKPLRDPGDDAKDETLEWLPLVPTNCTPEAA
jgi:hypothetical protein